MGGEGPGDVKVDSHGNFELSHYPEKFCSGFSLLQSVEFVPKRKFDPVEFSLFLIRGILDPGTQEFACFFWWWAVSQNG